MTVDASGEEEKVSSQYSTDYSVSVHKCQKVCVVSPNAGKVKEFSSKVSNDGLA